MVYFCLDARLNKPLAGLYFDSKVDGKQASDFTFITMTELFDDIPRTQGRRLEKTITLWVEPSTKEKYDILKEIHKVRVAECMRRVMDEELNRIMAIVTSQTLKAE